MFRKIRVTTARKMFDEGKTFYMVPCNMRPQQERYFGFNMTCIVDNYTRACAYSNFDVLVNSYSYYNCNAETGRTISYYVWED